MLLWAQAGQESSVGFSPAGALLVFSTTEAFWGADDFSTTAALPATGSAGFATSFILAGTTLTTAGYGNVLEVSSPAFVFSTTAALPATGSADFATSFGLVGTTLTTAGDGHVFEVSSPAFVTSSTARM